MKSGLGRLTVFSLLVVAYCAGLQSIAQASPQTKLNCPKAAGVVRGLFVFRESTARAIAMAVIAELQEKDVRDAFELVIKDEGDHWIAFQNTPAKQQGDAVIVTFGGGVEMDIAKCDGAISSLHWQK